MGLDQFLYARKYISGIDWTRNADGGYDRWENTDLDTVAGVVGLTREDLDGDSASAIVELKVAQWRKANHIHEWFVQNVQDGDDNCQQYYVSRENLEELRDRCREVIDMRDRQNANPDEMLPTAEDILPTQAGFFFGGTEYDEYYYETTEWTLDKLDRLLTDPKFKDFDFAYDSSW